jgi:hypothetical protein
MSALQKIRTGTVAPQLVYVVFFTTPGGIVEMQKPTTDEKERDRLIKYLDWVPKSGRVWYETYRLV